MKSPIYPIPETDEEWDEVPQHLQDQEDELIKEYREMTLEEVFEVANDSAVTGAMNAALRRIMRRTKWDKQETLI
jgi:hypothetical protein